jgi:hypothetical protein
MLATFERAQKLREQAMKVIYQWFAGLSPEELDVEILRVFRELDTDGTGTLNKQEFKAAFAKLGLNLTDEEVDVLFGEYDRDRSGLIDMHEFREMVLAFLEKAGNEPPLPPEVVAAAHQRRAAETAAAEANMHTEAAKAAKEAAKEATAAAVAPALAGGGGGGGEGAAAVVGRTIRNVIQEIDLKYDRAQSVTGHRLPGVILRLKSCGTSWRSLADAGRGSHPVAFTRVRSEGGGGHKDYVMRRPNTVPEPSSDHEHWEHSVSYKTSGGVTQPDQLRWRPNTARALLPGRTSLSSRQNERGAGNAGAADIKAYCTHSSLQLRLSSIKPEPKEESRGRLLSGLLRPSLLQTHRDLLSGLQWGDVRMTTERGTRSSLPVGHGERDSELAQAWPSTISPSVRESEQEKEKRQRESLNLLLPRDRVKSADHFQYLGCSSADSSEYSGKVGITRTGSLPQRSIHNKSALILRSSS